jgi:hypothetical protein
MQGRVFLTLSTNMNDPEKILQQIRWGEDNLLSEENAPPVDDALLTRYIAHDVTPEDSQRVSLLLASFASWRKRYVELIVQPDSRQSFS